MLDSFVLLFMHRPNHMIYDSAKDERKRACDEGYGERKQNAISASVSTCACMLLFASLEFEQKKKNKTQTAGEHNKKEENDQR